MKNAYALMRNVQILALLILSSITAHAVEAGKLVVSWTGTHSVEVLVYRGSSTDVFKTVRCGAKEDAEISLAPGDYKLQIDKGTRGALGTSGSSAFGFPPRRISITAKATTKYAPSVSALTLITKRQLVGGWHVRSLSGDELWTNDSGINSSLDANEITLDMFPDRYKVTFEQKVFGTVTKVLIEKRVNLTLADQEVTYEPAADKK